MEFDELLSVVKDAYNNDSQSELDIAHPDVQDLFFLLKCIWDNYMYFEYDRSTTNKLSAAELDIRKYEIQQLIVSKFKHGNNFPSWSLLRWRLCCI